MISDYTKSKKRGAIITGILSFVLTIGPAVFFFFKGFVQGDTHTKVGLSMVMIISLVLGALMLLFKAHLKRTLFWILFIGVYAAMHSMLSVVISMAVCNIIDEVVITPLHSRFVEDYRTNKQIDKRAAQLALSVTTNTE